MQNLFSRKILRKEIVLRKEAVFRIVTIRSTNSKVAFENSILTMWKLKYKRVFINVFSCELRIQLTHPEQNKV